MSRLERRNVYLGPWLGCLVWWFSSSLVNAAEPFSLERFFPSAATAGSPATITAEGKFPEWPVDIWCDRGEIKLSCLAEPGQIAIDVPASAAPGVAWVRLHNPLGVSSLQPVLIETVATALEQEPNNAIATAPAVSLPTTIFGRLEKNEDVDGVRIELAAQSILVARLIANGLFLSEMDAVLQITDLSGNVLAQSDDEWGLDPQLVYKVDAATEVVVRLFAFPATPDSNIGFSGAASYTYALRLSSGPVVDHFLPLVEHGQSTAITPFGWNLPTNTSQWTPATSVSPRVAFVPGAVGWQWLPAVEETVSTVLDVESTEKSFTTLPAHFSGHIGAPGENDVVRFRATAGEKIRCQVYSREFGFPLDSVLRMVDPVKNVEVARNDDTNGSQYNASLDFTPSVDGEFELHISDLAGSASERHAYTVRLAPVVPRVSASVAQDWVALKAGEEVEVVVTIGRIDGFDKQLSISAADLPPGVVADPVVSEATGESAKEVRLKLKAEPNAAVGHQHFRVLLTESPAAEDQSPRQWAARFQLRPQVAVEQLMMFIQQ